MVNNRPLKYKYIFSSLCVLWGAFPRFIFLEDKRSCSPSELLWGIKILYSFLMPDCELTAIIVYED